MKLKQLIMAGLVFATGLSQALYAFEPAKAKVTATTLNVRDLPSAGGDVVASLKRGDIIEVVEESKQEVTIDDQTSHWYKVVLPKKKTGWVFGGFISFEMNLESGLKWKIVSPADGEQFTGLAVSPEGTIFTGTASGNIYVSGPTGKWKKITPQALGISIGPITKILITGKTILATSSDKKRGGVWKSTNEGASWTQYTEAQGLPSNDVQDIRLKGNELWVATGKGIASAALSADKWAIAGVETPAPCLSVAVAPDGLVLAGTTNGLYKLGKSDGMFSSGKPEWIRIGEKTGNMGSKIYSLIVNDASVMAIGSNKGLIIGDKDGNSLNPIGGETSVNHIATDASGRIIVATKHGLSISTDQGKSWMTYKSEHGIRGNATHQISIGKGQQIWVSLDSQGLAFSE